MKIIRMAVSVLFLLPGLALAQIESSSLGTVSGAVVDKTGAAVGGAQVRLSFDIGLPQQTALSDSKGQFSFTKIAPGAFHLTVTAKGFAEVTSAGTLRAGETVTLPTTVLEVARVTTDVQVSGRQTELAEEQIKVEEKQRLLGFIPNYRVSYIHNAVPLVAKQKFEIAWKTTFDPISFGITGIIAGVQQWQKDYNGYGQGAEGYAKRYGAAYADFFIGNMISGAILPSVLRQDPRYFVKGNGSTGSRALYAIANSVICKGDNGHWQPRYSEIIGNLAASGISNLYYPAKDRNGASATFQNAAIGLGFGAAGNLFQEFVSRKITPKKK
jgi:hypothetical protein